MKLKGWPFNPFDIGTLGEGPGNGIGPGNPD